MKELYLSDITPNNGKAMNYPMLLIVLLMLIAIFDFHKIFQTENTNIIQYNRKRYPLIVIYFFQKWKSYTFFKKLPVDEVIQIIIFIRGAIQENF